MFEPTEGFEAVSLYFLTRFRVFMRYSLIQAAAPNGPHGIYIYIYIYILGSSARFARAEAYESLLWDYIMGPYYGIILQDCIAG